MYKNESYAQGKKVIKELSHVNIKYNVKHTIKVCTLISEDDPHLLMILRCM